MKKILVIINPAAGSRSAPQVKISLKEHFDLSTCELTPYETTGNEDLPQVVQKYLHRGQFDFVLAAGGDGTVSAVANGMIDHHIPLGIIPTGTSNALAQELGLPLDIDDTCALYSRDPAITTFDAIKINDRHFLLHVSIGLSAKIMGTDREIKNRWGLLAYIWTLVTTLRKQPLNEYELKIDGSEYRLKGIELLLANAASLGIPSLHWGQHIQPDDGRIDLCLLRPQKWWDYFLVIWDFVRGRPSESRFLQYFPMTKDVVVQSGGSGKIDTSGDGETLGQTPLEAYVSPSFVRLFHEGD